MNLGFLKKNNVRILLASGSAGAFGGFVSSIREVPHDSEPMIAQIWAFNQCYHIGCLGAILVGFAAGLAILLITMSSDHGDINPPFLRLVPMGVLAGFIGTPLLRTLAEKTFTIEEQKKALQQTVEKAKDATREIVSEVKKENNAVNELFEEGKRLLYRVLERKESSERELPSLKRSVELFEGALAKDPTLAQAYLEKAKALRAQAERASEKLASEEGKSLMKSALSSLLEAVKINQNYDRAYYNLACYRNLLEEGPEAVVAELEKAISLSKSNAEAAKVDNDFENLKDNALFLRATGLSK